MSTKVRVTITAKMIETYRRSNMSPNLFQDYISSACLDSSAVSAKIISVFVFQEQLNITLSPNKTHSFKVPYYLGMAFMRYYQVRETCPVDFTLDFRDNSIEVHDIGEDVK